MLLIAFKAVSKHTTVQRVDSIGVNRLSFAKEVLPGRPSLSARTGVAWEQAPSKKELGERSEAGDCRLCLRCTIPRRWLLGCYKSVKKII